MYVMHCALLLLGMWNEGGREFSDEASPHALTFVDTLTINTTIIVLQESITPPNSEALA
jgi:hypothetical protein